MNVVTRSKTGNSKRKSTDLEVNSSMIYSRKKQRKYYRKKDIMEGNSRNSNQGQIHDLSGTINVTNEERGASFMPRPNNTVPDGQGAHGGVDDDVGPDVRELVVSETQSIQRNLEGQVRRLVNDEMVDVRKTLGDLTLMVKELSKTRKDGSDSSAPNNFPSRGQDVSSVNNPSMNLQDIQVGNSNCLPNGRAGMNPYVMPFPADRPMTQHVQNDEMRRSCSRESGSSNADGNNGQIRIRIDKFGLLFNGNTSQMSIDDFVFRLECLQAQYDIPWSEVVRDFRVLLSGTAYEWYWLNTKSRTFTDWPSLRHALFSQYQTVRSTFELMRDLSDRRQQNNESIDAYFQIMCQLRSKLLQPIPEYDMIKILKRNVKESLGRIVYPMMISSVEQLRMECNEAERNFPRREIRNAMPPPRTNRFVNEVYMDDENDEDDIPGYMPTEDLDAINMERGALKTMVNCWNCHTPGHIFRDCPSQKRSLFCYRCGKPNVTTPTCPTCTVAGNQKRGVGRTGTLRQTEVPVTVEK